MNKSKPASRRFAVTRYERATFGWQDTLDFIEADSYYTADGLIFFTLRPPSVMTIGPVQDTLVRAFRTKDIAEIMETELSIAGEKALQEWRDEQMGKRLQGP